MLDLICQIWIVIFTVPAMILIATSNKKTCLLGYRLGILAQPAFLVTSIIPTFKLGLFIVSIIFLIAWVQGYFVKKKGI